MVSKQPYWILSFNFLFMGLANVVLSFSLLEAVGALGFCFVLIWGLIDLNKVYVFFDCFE